MLLALVWLVQLRSAPTEVVARRDCQRRYQEARTQEDTLAVDGQVLFAEPQDSPTARTCATLRGAGDLR